MSFFAGWWRDISPKMSFQKNIPPLSTFRTFIWVLSFFLRMCGYWFALVVFPSPRSSFYTESACIIFWVCFKEFDTLVFRASLRFQSFIQVDIRSFFLRLWMSVHWVLFGFASNHRFYAVAVSLRFLSFCQCVEEGEAAWAERASHSCQSHRIHSLRKDLRPFLQSFFSMHLIFSSDYRTIQVVCEKPLLVSHHRMGRDHFRGMTQLEVWLLDEIADFEWCMRCLPHF